MWEGHKGQSWRVLAYRRIIRVKREVHLPPGSVDGVGTVGEAADVITKIVSERAESPTV